MTRPNRTTRRVAATVALVAVVVAGSLPAAGLVGAAAGGGAAATGGSAAAAATSGAATSAAGGAPAATDTAATGGAATSAADDSGGPGAADLQTPTNNSSVNVTVGSQLSTVVAVTSASVRSDVEETEFDLEYASSDSERAEVLAERAETLGERAAALREDYRQATRAYERGELTRDEYARRLATLNARARSLLDSYDALRNRSANVSGVELAAAGLNATAVERTVAGLDNLTGAGLSALLDRFLADRDGEVSIETRRGVEVEVESDDGERTREFERPGDGSRNITVAQSRALETARSALSDRDGRWVLRRASVHEYEGTFRFRFGLVANATTGEARVTVDGSSGAVVELETEVEPRDDDERDRDDERDDRRDDDREDDEFENESEDREDEEYDELALVVVSGRPAPGATLTVRALADRRPVPNATVGVNDAAVATTGRDGTATVRLPADAEEVELEVRARDAEGELEFEFEDRGVYGRLATRAGYDGRQVRLQVTYAGTGVANATVTVNGDVVGTTGPNGTVTFAPNGSRTLDVTVTKGRFAAAVTYVLDDGSLRLAEAIHRSDDRRGDEDDDEREDERDDGEREDEREDDDREDDDREDDDDDRDDEVDDDDLTLAVVSGRPAPGATLTVRALVEGQPVAGATVLANDAAVATTGADGTATVRLPAAAEEVELVVQVRDAERELEFEFDDDDGTDTPEDETDTPEEETDTPDDETDAPTPTPTG